MLKGQAERLFPMLEELLTEARIAWQSIAALGVGIGPGNFTGIRIAVASARGLALSLGIPAFGVSTFEVMLGENPPGRTIMVSLMAPRDMAYVQTFRDGVATALPDLLDPSAPLPDGFKGGTIKGYRADDFATQSGADTEGLPEVEIATAIGRIAAERFRRGEVPDRPSPLYVRPADAAPSSEPPLVILP